jgi:Protein of unknown function (DUF3667)
MSDEPAKVILGDTAISAIEQPPGRKGFFRRRTRPKLPFVHCENCGAQLIGPYCAQCGQPAIDYRRSFRHIIVDVLDSFLNWDSKFFATIGLVIARPWQLTNEFIAGKRVRYLHPLRLYLLASILFFFAVTFWAKSVHLHAGNVSPEERAALRAELQGRGNDLSKQIRADVNKALQAPSPRANPEPAGSVRPAASPAPPAQPSKTEKEALAKSPAPGAENQPVLQFGPEKPANGLEKWLQERAKEKFGEHGSRAQLFFISMINNLPYMMLCSIPLFALILKLLYIRNRIFYIDHLIYALHIHTFTYVAVILIALATIGLNRAAPGAIAGWIIGLLWFGFALQIFLSIRRVYRQGWIKSFIKFWLGGAVYFFILMLGFAATFFITLAAP